MRKVSLRMNGEQKYQAIKKLAEHAGNKQRATLKLGVTLRTIDRLLAAYRRKGKAGVLKVRGAAIFIAGTRTTY